MNKKLVEMSLQVIFESFQQPYFPRTISTQKSGGKQITVNSISEILEHFEKSNWFDCRISLFGQIEIDQIIPNTIFIDLDDTTSLEIVKDRITHLVGGVPLIIHTGRGYAIVQPITIQPMKGWKKDNLNDYEISTKFLKYSKDYLTNGRADKCNNPSLKSCLLRVPNTINSKNGKTVQFIQSWNKKRISVKKFPFKEYLSELTRQQSQIHINTMINPQNFQWIEKLLQTKIDDNRHFLLFDVTRYLINIKNISDKETIDIIVKWLDSPKYPRSTISYRVRQALKDQKYPRNLTTIQRKNPEVYEYLISKGVNQKRGEL